MKDYKLYDLKLMSMSRPPPRLQPTYGDPDMEYETLKVDAVCEYFGIDSYGNKVNITLTGQKADCLTNEETLVELIK